MVLENAIITSNVISYHFLYDMVHQIGFIPPSGRPCSRVVLLNVLAMKRGKFYTIDCRSDSCMGGNISSLAPSCLGSGSNNSCRMVLSHCMKLLTLVIDDGILITMYLNHNVSV